MERQREKKGEAVCVREREKGSKVGSYIRDRLQRPRARDGLSHVHIGTKKKEVIAGAASLHLPQ